MFTLLEVWRRKGQFLLVAVVFGLVGYLVFMVNGLGAGLNDLAGSAVRNFDADDIAYPDTAGLSILRSEISEDGVATLQGLDGVEAGAISYTSASFRDADGRVDSAAVLGFDPGTIAEPKVVEGRALTPDDTSAVLADRRFLRESGLGLGDTVEMELRLATAPFEIAGVVDEGSFFFQPSLFLLREPVRELKYGDAEGSPAASIVLLKGDVPASVPGFEIVSKSTAFANIEGVAGQQSTITSLQFLGYTIGALILGAFFYIFTLQKTPQLALSRALGASGWNLATTLAVQVMITAAAGLIAGAILASLSGRAIANSGTVPVVIETRTLVSASIIFVVIALLSVALSVRRILRLDPALALSRQV